MKKKPKRLINVIKHVPTGAKIPIKIRKINGNQIEDYAEIIEGRRAFTISMLENRWDMTKEDIIDLLQKYQIPGHIKHTEVEKLNDGKMPIDTAYFFEEYIFALEKKAGLPHSKLKSILLSSLHIN